MKIQALMSAAEAFDKLSKLPAECKSRNEMKQSLTNYVKQHLRYRTEFCGMW